MNSQKHSNLAQSSHAYGTSFWLRMDKSGRAVVLSLTLAAFVLRLIAFFLFQEKAGDGPSHAMLAYMWSESPVFRPHEAWLPGYIYLTGMFNMVVGDPLISARIFNLLLGTLTVPILYFLIRRVFDHVSALLSATLLAVFPFHIYLSVTSLTEISFLLEIIAGTLLVLQASVMLSWGRLVALIFSTLLLGLASLTRYEAWILLPLFPSYYFLKTGRFYQSVFLTIGLALFPTAWMLTSYFETGSILPAYDAALFQTGGGTNLPGALMIIAFYSITYLGWLIPFLTAVGLLLLFMDTAKRQLSKERLLYLAIMCITGLFIVKFGMDRGSSLRLRYLLFIFVMILPIGNFAITRYLRKKPFIIILVVLLAAAPPFISQIVNKHKPYVTQNTRRDVQRLSRWLADSPFRESPILLTEMRWDSTLLPLYRPEIAFRYFIVSDWFGDSYLRDFLSTFQPQLLITRDGEHEYISRIEKSIGEQILEHRLIYDQDTFKAFDLRGLFRAPKVSNVPTNHCVLVGPGFLTSRDKR